MGDSAAMFSREQLHRALSFVDVSADGLITHKELRGSLMGTDMQAFDSQNFSRLLLRNVEPVRIIGNMNNDSSLARLMITSSSNDDSGFLTDGGNIGTSPVKSGYEYHYNDVLENLVRLLDGRDQSSTAERRLAERAVEHLLRQREDDASSYEAFRFFQAALFFILPPVGMLFGGIGGCCLGPESNAVWVPLLYRDCISDGWKEEYQMQMLSDLNNYIKRSTDRSIGFRITLVVFRLHRPSFEKDVKIRMKINDAFNRNHGSASRHIKDTPFFISCPEDTNVQSKAQRALLKMDIETLLEEEKGSQVPREFHIQKAVMKCLKETFVDRKVRPLATSIGVWEVRLDCHLSSSSGEYASAPQLALPLSTTPLLLKTESEATAHHLSGAEVVYQHESQTIEFHNPVSEDDYLSQNGEWSHQKDPVGERLPIGSDLTMSPPQLFRMSSEEYQKKLEFESGYRRQIERFRRGFITIVRRSVFKRSWWRMICHQMLNFSFLVLSVVVWYATRLAADEKYSCAMPFKKTPEDKSKCAKMKSLVSSAEFLRVVALFVLLGSMSSIKNMWLINSQSTRTGRLSSREAVYMKAFEDIADLPRLGLHHKDVGRIFPNLLALLWVMIPIHRRMEGNNLSISRLFSLVARFILNFMGLQVPWVLPQSQLYSNAIWDSNNSMALLGNLLHRRDILVQMPGTNNTISSSVSVTEILSASILGTETGINNWDYQDLAVLGFLTVAIASVVASIFARCWSILMSFPWWEGVFAFFKYEYSVQSHGFSESYHRLYFYGMALAGIFAPPLIIVIFTVQSYDDNVLIWNWEAMTSAVLLVSASYWIFLGIWHYIIVKVLLRDARLELIESFMVLACSVLVLATNLSRFAIGLSQNKKDPLPQSANVSLILSTSLISYFLMTTFLRIMHGNYVYFERLTKIMELFTKASMHASWYAFLRNFSRSSRDRRCSPLRCCSKCRGCESVMERVKFVEAKRLSEHIMVIERVKRGPMNAQGTGRNSKMAFTAFDLSSKADVIHWNQTRMRLIQECNSPESQIRMVNLNVLTLITSMTAGIAILRRFVELLDENEDHPGRLRIVETSISNSSNMLMQGMLFVCLGFFLPTIYQRLRLTQMQEQHISLLVDAKHRVRILIGASGLQKSGKINEYLGNDNLNHPHMPREQGLDINDICDEQSKEELEDVIELLKESINKLEISDAKPTVFGIELEALSARNMLSLFASLLGIWFYFETGGAVGAA